MLPSTDYWCFIRSRFNRGLDTLDNNLDVILETINRLIAFARENDDYIGVIITIEMFTDLIFTYKKFINLENLIVYSLFKSIYYDFEEAIFEYFTSIDERESQENRVIVKILNHIYDVWHEIINKNIYDFFEDKNIGHDELMGIIQRITSKYTDLKGIKSKILSFKDEDKISEIITSDKDYLVLLDLIITGDKLLKEETMIKLILLIENKEIREYYDYYIQFNKVKETTLSNFLKQKDEVEEVENYKPLLLRTDGKIYKDLSLIKYKIFINGKFGIQKNTLQSIIENNKYFIEVDQIFECTHCLIGINSDEQQLVEFDGELINFLDLLKLLSLN
jgi:hypothetical protein